MYFPSLLAPVIPDVPRHGDIHSCSVRYAEAQAERDRIKTHYDEAIGFAYPGRTGFSLTANGSAIYDDTAVVAAPEFASNIQMGIMPNFSRWASHIAGIMVEDAEERAEIRTLLEQVDVFIFSMINTSNAVSEIHESLMDLAVGTGALRIDRGISLHPLNVRAVRQGALSFTVGADGQPDAIFEDRMLTLSEIDVDYPDCDVPAAALEAGAINTPIPPLVAGPRRLRVVECWQRDWTEPRANRWKMSLLFPDHQNAVGMTDEQSGAGACPYIIFRWSKGSGEAWGRGPLINVLPSMRTVNFAMQALIDHSDLALAGVWNVEDDGVVNVDTIRLEPGAVIPKAAGSAGLQNLVPGAGFDIQQFMLAEMRKNIKQALYTDELGDPNRSPKTATEVQQRMANLARRIGSSFGRLIVELVFPFIMRVTRVLKDQGLIKLPTVDGKRIGMIPSSPLAQAQSFDAIDAMDRFTALIRDRFGTEALNMLVDASEAVDYLAEQFPVPQRILRKKEKAAELAMTMAEGLAGGSGQGAGLGGEVIPDRNALPATG